MMKLILQRSYCICALLIVLCFSACSTVRWKVRQGKDMQLNEGNYKNLQGRFSNITLDGNRYNRTLYSNFKIDTLYRQKEFSVEITPVDVKHLNVKLYENDIVIDSIKIKGKFKRGYFKAKRSFTKKFIVGPLVWVLGESLTCIGLTKENNLVILNSGGAGTMLLLVMPIFVAGRSQFEHEYERRK